AAAPRFFVRPHQDAGPASDAVDDPIALDERLHRKEVAELLSEQTPAGSITVSWMWAMPFKSTLTARSFSDEWGSFNRGRGSSRRGCDPGRSGSRDGTRAAALARRDRGPRRCRRAAGRKIGLKA